MSYINSIILFLFLFVQTTPSIGLQNIGVVRIDDGTYGGHRVFIVQNESIVRNNKNLRHYLNLLKHKIALVYPDWESDWNASIFTKKEFVGYKDEDKNLPYVVSGEWEKSYIAEYSKEQNVCTIYPLNPKKQLKLKISE